MKRNLAVRKMAFGFVPRLLVNSLIASFCLLPAQAFSQLATDQVPRERTVPIREQVQAEVEKSRFRLGSISIVPKLSIRDAGYNNNVFGSTDNPVADWTATISAGVRCILPLGSKIYLRGDAVPEYIWYAQLAQGRTLGGRYSASVLGFFNRMSVEATGFGSKSSSILNSESETRVIDHLLSGSGKIEIDLLRRLSVFAGGGVQRHRYAQSPPGPPDVINAKDLDRTDSTARAGIRYHFLSYLDISAGVEGIRTQFAQTPQERDNRSTAYLLGLHYGRPRLFINLSGGYRTGQAYNGSAFPRYSTATGSYFVSYSLAAPIELQVYGLRGPVYALYLDNPYYLEMRNGGGVNVQIIRQLWLRGYGEYGTNSYPVPVPVDGGGSVNRLDQATTVGGGLSVLLARNAVLTALVSRTSYSSNIPGLGRSVLRFTTSFSLEETPTR
ncbi:MAG: hypothetical protein ACRD1B_06525 [Thermoanaerobaculia bacterium]